MLSQLSKIVNGRRKPMEKKKGYLHKFTLTEKFIAFCISIAISYITIISILLHDDFLALRDGTLYFFISLFL